MYHLNSDCGKQINKQVLKHINNVLFGVTAGGEKISASQSIIII